MIFPKTLFHNSLPATLLDIISPPEDRMAEVFEYKDLMTARLDEEEARLNSRDPTGTAAKTIMPAKRNRAQQNRPKFYDPEQ